MRYRKKPVEVEAILWDGTNTVELMDFVGPFNVAWFGNIPEIETLEGRMMVSKGDWVIIDAGGELYPCKPDVFDDVYEPVT